MLTMLDSPRLTHGADLDLEHDEKAALKSLQAVFDTLLQVRSTMTLQQAIMLMSAATDEGHTQAFYAARLNYVPSIVSRNFQELGNRSRRYEEGMHLIEVRPAPDNLRENNILLAPKGRALVKKLARKIRGVRE